MSSRIYRVVQDPTTGRDPWIVQGDTLPGAGRHTVWADIARFRTLTDAHTYIADVTTRQHTLNNH